MVNQNTLFTNDVSWTNFQEPAMVQHKCGNQFHYTNVKKKIKRKKIFNTIRTEKIN